jgi:hypothetical protein
MNDSAQSGEELLRQIDTERAKGYRRFYGFLAIVCAVPIGITATLWLVAVLT